MTNYIGEFDCKVDAKGRMMVPAGLLKQFAPAIREKFVINRSVFQKCLVLYPMDAWGEIVKDLGKLNKFIKENDDFIRQYNNGATQVEMDTTNRILLPKRLLDFAGIDKDVVLTANLNKIEIWSAEKYNAIINNYDPDSFGALAERVMGKSNPSSTSNDLP
jgi:MraZ protein